MIHKIKALYDRKKGLSIRGIARKLKISRNTVKKYLDMDEETIQKQKDNQSRFKRLDNQREYIIYLLETFPLLSAVKVLRRIKDKFPVLDVSDRSARRYIKELKETVTLKQRRYYEPILDMVPGVQCQVDGGEIRAISVGGRETVIYFVVFVLSYSRMMYAGLSRDPVNTDVFIRMHDEAFRYFGGCPEECVYDQTKLVVLHEQYRELDLNQRFHSYATAAGFRIHACEGYDPESKGKVEAGVKYIKNNALYGETFADWPELEQYLKQWLNNTANIRNHGTTRESPLLRYDRDERPHMSSYLTPTYLTQSFSSQETRKVDKTGLLSWKSNKYSAPMKWQQARVGVGEDGTQLIISNLENGKEIARHKISHSKSKVIKNNDHYRDKQKRIIDLENEIRQLLNNEDAERLCALLKRSNIRIYKDQLTGLMGLLKRYPMPAVLLNKLCDRPTLSTSQIQDYLEAYGNHPERFQPANDIPSSAGNKTEPAPLARYADVAQQDQEINYAKLH